MRKWCGGSLAVNTTAAAARASSAAQKKCFLSGQKIYIFRENNEGGEGDEHNEIYILLK